VRAQAVAVVLRVVPSEVTVDGLGVASIAAACLCWAFETT